MHRIDAANHVSNTFSEGDPVIPIVPTAVDAAWLNAVQGELVNTIEGLGDAVTLVKGNNTQIRDLLGGLLAAHVPGGRLTLQSGFPVSSADQAGKTTIYYAPHRHNKVPLYDGTRWRVHAFSQLSQTTTDTTKSPAAVAANKNYDLFVWLDGSTPRLSRGTAWFSDTQRRNTTEVDLEQVDGRWVNAHAVTNGPTARRGLYVGTVRSNGSSQIDDTTNVRHVWNMYNRAPRTLNGGVEGVPSWTYTPSTVRQANANSANQANFVVGLSEDALRVELVATVELANARAGVGIGYDSTSALSGRWGQFSSNAASPVLTSTLAASLTVIPSVGAHYVAWLEFGNSGSGATFYATFSGTSSGLSGSIMG